MCRWSIITIAQITIVFALCDPEHQNVVLISIFHLVLNMLNSFLQ